MKSIFSLAFLLCCFYNLSAQVPSIVWQKYYGTRSFISIKQTVDSGYIAVGESYIDNTNVESHGGTDVYVIKTDAEGNAQWSKSYGGAGTDRGFDIVLSDDGGYTFCGETFSLDGDLSSMAGETGGWVVHIDSVGEIIWQRVVNGSPSKILKEDDGYVIANSSVLDLLQTFMPQSIMKLSNNGQITDSLALVSNFGYVLSAIAKSGDDYVVAGWSSPDSTMNSLDIDIRKYDSDFDLIWQESYSYGIIDQEVYVVALENGDIVFAANTGNGSSDIWVTRIDSNGAVINDTIFDSGEFLIILDFIETSDSNFLVCGKSDTSGFMLSLDAQFNPNWYFLLPYDTLVYDVVVPEGLVETSSGVIVCGNRLFVGWGETTIFKLGDPLPIIDISFNLSDTSSCDTTACTADIDLDIETGTPPFIYEWSNGATTEDLTNICSGIYDVTVTDSTGTSSTASITVNIVEPIITPFFNVTNATCQLSNGGIDLTVSGGVEPYTFLWSDSSTNEDLTNVLAGVYYVTFTDANGCSTWNGTEILGSPPVTISISSTLSCGDSAGAINLTVNTATAPLTYNWSNSDSLEDLSGIDSGMYSVTVVDALGCSASDSAYIDFHVPPTACITTINSPCACVAPHTVNFLSCSEPTTGLTFNWMFFGGTVTSQQGNPLQNVTYDSPGSYPVWLSVMDSNGCSNMSGGNEIVQINDETVSFIGPDTVMVSSTVSYQAFNLDNYNWDAAPDFNVLTSDDSSSMYSVYFIQTGFYNVCLESEFILCDSICIVETCKTVVVIDSTSSIGIHQAVLNNFSVNAHPNPTKGIVTFDFNSSTNQALNLKLYDVAGRVADEIIITANTSSQQFDLSLLPKEVYFYTFEALDRQVVARGKLAVE